MIGSVLRVTATSALFAAVAHATTAVAHGPPAVQYYDVSIESLEITDGELPRSIHDPWRMFRDGARAAVAGPRALLDGPGEAFVYLFEDPGVERARHVRLAVRTDGARAVHGRLLLPDRSFEEQVAVGFVIPAHRADPSARDTFFEARRSHYRRLTDAGAPGAAWFRLQAVMSRMEARDAGGEAFDASEVDSMLRELGYVGADAIEADDLATTLELFTGARALSENLQLDRVLRPGTDHRPSVAIDALPGITIEEYDWRALTEGMDPPLDHLASVVPVDQHGLFFPSFDALALLVDEATRTGTPLLHLLEEQSVDADTQARYERQLCLG